MPPPCHEIIPPGAPRMLAETFTAKRIAIPHALAAEQALGVPNAFLEQRAAGCGHGQKGC
jgi:hypothetical protein